MAKSDHWQVLAEAAVTSDRSPSSTTYLADVRSRSCYTLLRMVHSLINGLAMVGCVIVLIVLLCLAETESAALSAILLCTSVIVGLVIERGLFTIIVDVGDVLVDIGRRRSE